MKRGLGVVETSWARHLIVEGERKKKTTEKWIRGRRGREGEGESWVM